MLIVELYSSHYFGINLLNTATVHFNFVLSGLTVGF